MELGSSDPRLKYIMDGRIKIKPKTGGPAATLVPSRVQRKVLNAVNEDVKLGRPVRQLDLKPRQVMMSSIIAAFFYGWARVESGISILVAANENDTVKDLWTQKYQTFKRTDEDEPETYHDSMKTLHFKDTDSAIDVRIGDIDLGRGGTRQGLHLTEFPYMKNPDGVWQEVVPCVPNHPGTAIFIESTGARPGDLYERMFRDAWEAQKDDRLLEFRAMFFPWTDQEDYEIALSEEDADLILEKLDQEEKDLIRFYGLTTGHIAWRRLTLQRYQGDRSEFVRRFPLTPDEAFSARYESCFDMKALDWYEKVNICEPKYKAQVELSLTKTPIVHERETGDLWVWQPAAHRFTYTMYMDAAGDYGEESQKYHSKSAIAVIENETGEQVATWEGRVHPADFARVGYAIGEFYNQATIVCETNNHGHLVFDELVRRLNYRRMWWNDQYRGGVLEKQMGLTLDINTRSEIVGNMQKLVSWKRIGLRCPRTFAQMKTFVKPLAGSQRAKKGHNDDLVIATAGAAWVASRHAEWASKEDAVKRIADGEASSARGRIWVPGMEDDMRELMGLKKPASKTLIDMILSGGH